jgi:hypothetical protein
MLALLEGDDLARPDPGATGHTVAVQIVAAVTA